MSVLSNTGSVVLCDDILGLILNELPVKDLFRFQRVSQQFRDCTEEALQKTQSLAIGCDEKPKDYEDSERLIKSITGSIDLMAIDVSPAILDYHMDSFLTKFRAVKRLYLKKVLYKFKEMAITVKQLPRLEEIYFFDFEIKSQKRRVQTSRQWADLWVNVKHIAIAGLRRKHVTLMANIIRQLASLQSLEIYDMSIASDLLVDCMPANIRSLKVMRDTFDTQSIESLTTKCRQIQELSLSSHIEKNSDFNGFDEWILIICNRLKDLKSLRIPLAEISSQVFAENIVKLSKLRHLAIESHSSGFMLFDTTSMTPMASLRSLSLYGIKCSPEMWSQFKKVLPNLRRLSLDAINCHIDCVHSLDKSKVCLKRCFERSMNSVANQIGLKVLSLGYQMSDYDDNVLKAIHLFKHLDQLCIHTDIDGITKNVYKFLTQSLSDRNRAFCLGLLSEQFDEFLTRMNEPDVQMPPFLRIKDCGPTDHYDY